MGADVIDVGQPPLAAGQLLGALDSGAQVRPRPCRGTLGGMSVEDRLQPVLVDVRQRLGQNRLEHVLDHTAIFWPPGRECPAGGPAPFRAGVNIDQTLKGLRDGLGRNVARQRTGGAREPLLCSGVLTAENSGSDVCGSLAGVLEGENIGWPERHPLALAVPEICHCIGSRAAGCHPQHKSPLAFVAKVDAARRGGLGALHEIRSVSFTRGILDFSLYDPRRRVGVGMGSANPGILVDTLGQRKRNSLRLEMRFHLSDQRHDTFHLRYRTEQLGKLGSRLHGLQIRAHRFDSGRRLQIHPRFSLLIGASGATIPCGL